MPGPSSVCPVGWAVTLAAREGPSSARECVMRMMRIGAVIGSMLVTACGKEADPVGPGGDSVPSVVGRWEATKYVVRANGSNDTWDFLAAGGACALIIASDSASVHMDITYSDGTSGVGPELLLGFNGDTLVVDGSAGPVREGTNLVWTFDEAFMDDGRPGSLRIELEKR
jgi:hypothetical protein